MTFNEWWEAHRTETWITVEVSKSAAQRIWREAQDALMKRIEESQDDQEDRDSE